MARKAPKTSRVTLRGYADIMRELTLRPTRHDHLVAKMRRQQNDVRRLMLRMRSQELAHILRWEPVAPRRPRQPVWAAGPGDDAPYPTASLNYIGRTSAPKTGVELTIFAHFWHALADRKHTTPQLAELTGWSPPTVQSLIRHCRKIKLVRVSEWERRVGLGGAPKPYFELGSEADAPRPALLSYGELSRLRRARQRASDPMRFIARCISANDGATTKAA